MEKKNWDEIHAKIAQFDPLERFDMIVAIGRGGIEPAKLLSKKFNVGYEVLQMRYRDDNHKIIHPHPKIVRDVDFQYAGKKILLVDDVSRTAATLNAAKSMLKDAETVKTFVLNGKADYRVYHEPCFRCPWEDAQ